MGIETVFLAIGAATGLVGAGTAISNSNAASKQATAQKKLVNSQEAELAAEAAARTAAAKKAETTGQWVGFGAGVSSARNTFVGGVGSQGTGFGGTGAAPKEDNIGRGTLFGN